MEDSKRIFLTESMKVIKQGGRMAQIELTGQRIADATNVLRFAVRYPALAQRVIGREEPEISTRWNNFWTMRFKAGEADIASVARGLTWDDQADTMGVEEFRAAIKRLG